MIDIEKTRAKNWGSIVAGLEDCIKVVMRP